MFETRLHRRKVVFKRLEESADSYQIIKNLTHLPHILYQVISSLPKTLNLILELFQLHRRLRPPQLQLQRPPQPQQRLRLLQLLSPRPSSHLNKFH